MQIANGLVEVLRCLTLVNIAIEVLDLLACLLVLEMGAIAPIRVMLYDPASSLVEVMSRVSERFAKLEDGVASSGTPLSSRRRRDSRSESRAGNHGGK